MTENWEQKAKGLLKSELKRQDLTYSQLSEKLAAVGIAETPENIANKISRVNSRLCFFFSVLKL